MKKLFLLIILSICCCSSSYFLGTLFAVNTDIPICTTVSLKKAEEIQNFLSTKNLPTHIEIWKDAIQIYSNSTSEKEHNEASIYIAESNLVDGSVKYIHPYIKNTNSIVEFDNNSKNLANELQRSLEKRIKKIDGVANANVTIKIKKEIQEKNKTRINIEPVIINIEVFEDFNIERIRQTTQNLLKGQEHSLNITPASYDKSKYVFWDFGRYKKNVKEACSKKDYEEAIKIINEANEKRNNTFDINKINCIEKIYEISKKIEQEPTNYKLYIERGKLQAPDDFSLYLGRTNPICCMQFTPDDTQNAIADYKKALELNPNAKEVYELLFWAKLYSKFPSNIPQYSKEALEYGLKAIKYKEDYRLYEEISDLYYYSGDYYKSSEFSLKAKQKREEEKAKLEEGEYLPDSPLPKPYPSIELNIIDKIQNKLYLEPKYCVQHLQNYKKAISYADTQIKENANNASVVKQELQKELKRTQKANFSCKIISKFI